MDLKDYKKVAEKKNKKKHQWGWFQNPNAGNVDYNNKFFNNTFNSNSGEGVSEEFYSKMEEDMNDVVELNYDDLDVEVEYGETDWTTGEKVKSHSDIVSYTLELEKPEVIVELQELFAEEHPELPDAQVDAFVEENFDELFEENYQYLLDKHRDQAIEQATEKYAINFDPSDLFDECIHIPESLNRIDCETCNKFDLYNLYESQNLSPSKKHQLAKMLNNNASDKELYEFLTEDTYSDEDDDDLYMSIRNRYYAEEPTDNARFTEISRKSVYDADGFTTDYVWYKDNFTGNHVMVFGDSDIYYPEDEQFDAVFETETEAKEWFDNYNGFDDDDDIGLLDDFLDEGYTEGYVKNLVQEVEDNGGIDSWVSNVRDKLDALQAEITYLKKEAPKYTGNRGGSQESKEDIDSAIKGVQKQYDDLEKIYQQVVSLYHINA